MERESDELKKKTAELAVEDQEVKRLLHQAARSRQVDLEAWETAIRAAVLNAGALPW
jgi:hypothetical protein